MLMPAKPLNPGGLPFPCCSERGFPAPPEALSAELSGWKKTVKGMTFSL